MPATRLTQLYIYRFLVHLIGVSIGTHSK